MKAAGSVRWVRALMAFLLLFGMFAPTLIWISELKAYALSPETLKVIGAANPNLSAKFSFDKEQNKWQFNKNGVASLADTIAKRQPGRGDAEGVANALSQLTAKQVGGVGKNDQSLYSVDLSVKAKDGIVYYDNVTRLSFKMVPDFVSRDAKLVKNRIVYPIGNNGRVVYTAKSNGLKEDIVLDKFVGDTLRYGYKLELPEALEARVLDDGSIGVYSANPALYGNITFSNDEDRARVMEARKTGTKDYLVFGIPAPYIKDQTGKVGHTRYELRGASLTVVASGLKGLTYPLSVDPSVTVSSSSEFQTGGNDEGMISFGTAGQITRNAITGGTIGAWNFTDNSVNRGTTQGAGSGAANGMIAARNAHRTVAYNGYMYAIGGDTQGTTANTVERAPINSDGTLGTWVSSGTLPEARSDHVSFAYNGYMYIVGGYTGGGSFSADVKFAQINADGTLGAWTGTTSLPVGRINHAALAYDGRMYVINGCTTAAGNCNTANPTAVVYCADILATGQVGAWGTCNTSGLTARDGFSAVAYNGYIYGMGGCATYSLFACNSLPRHVQYAKINSDGTLGNWTTSSALFTTDRGSVNIVAYGGYIYLTGDSGTDFVNDMQYVPIYANGSIGTWSTTASYGQTRNLGSLSVYNNYLYMIGGCTTRTTGVCSNTKNDVQFAPIDAAGSLATYSAEADFDTNARDDAAVVAAQGYLYILGGRVNGSGVGSNTGVYAPLNADGSVGAWSATTPFADIRQGATATAHGNSVYMVGGGTNNSGTGNCTFVDSGVGRQCTKVERATINPSTGQLTWVDSFTYYVDNPRKDTAVVINNNYFYVIGGIYNNNSTESAEVDFAPLNADGTLGTFAKTTASLSTGRGDGVGAVAWGGKIYVIGGREHPTAEYATPDPVTGQITSWASTGNALPLVGGQPTRSMAISGSNGYIYVNGGVSTSLNISAATQVARINADGTMGNWVTSTQTMARTRFDHGSAISGGVLYVLGGCGNTLCTSGNSLKNYQYAKLNNNGSGQTGAWTASSSNGSAAIGGYATYNGYVYSLRGCGGAVGIGDLACDNLGIGSQGMVYAAVNPDGSFGAWQTLSSAGAPPTARYGTSAVAYNGYLYVLGGCTAYASGACSTFSKEVFYAPINSNGDVGTWATTTDFDATTGRLGLSAVAYNGYLYVLGGCTANSSSACTTYQNSVRVAQINANGTVGAWSSAGSSFATARFYQSAVAYNGYLYVLGGCSAMVTDGCTGLRNDVQVIGLNSNGTLNGSWRVIRSFPVPRTAFGAVAYNGYLYIAGGCAQFNATGGTCSDYKNDIEYAAISLSGEVGDWNRSSTNMTNGTTGHGLAIVNGNLVSLFGVKATHSYEAVARSSQIQLQPRIGKYSKLVAINPTTDIAGVYYNGTLGSGSSVTYRVAPTTGIFSAAVAAAQGSGAEPTPACGMGSIYYVQLMANMDDSNRAVFPDDVTSNVTDMTVYYRLNATPPPNLRLNGGKWFYAETQQALDICKS